MHAGHFGRVLECRGLPAARIGQRETVHVVASSFPRDEVQSPTRLENAVSPAAGHLRVFSECNLYENSKLIFSISRGWQSAGTSRVQAVRTFLWCLGCLSRPEIRPQRTKQQRPMKQAR